MKQLLFVLGWSACSLASQQVPVQEYVPPTLEEATTTSEVLGHLKLALLDCDPQIPFVAGLRERFTGCRIEYIGSGNRALDQARFFVYVTTDALQEYCTIYSLHSNCLNQGVDCTDTSRQLLRAERIIRTWSEPLFRGCE